MHDWTLWFVLAGVTVIFELFTGSFYLLMIAIGLAAGGLAAWLGAAAAMQMTVAAIVGVVAVGLLRRSRFGKHHVSDAARDPNVNIDIGQTIQVDRWDNGSARVMYRGALWDVDLAEGEPHEPGRFVIREVRGNRLIVARQ